MRTSRPAVLTVAALLAAVLSGCGGSSAQEGGGGADASTTAGAAPLVVYSGRNEELVGGLLDQLRSAVGTDVEIRYGDSAELAAQLLEEGDATDADLFFSQDAGALGALAGADRLAELPDEVLSVAPERFRAADGRWVATSARARVVAYDPARVPAADLPASLDDLVDPRWRGQVGYAPTNASWQSFVTAVRVVRGEDGARDWLTRFAANDPVRYDRNGLILDAVDAGEVSLGLINHYYWFEKAAEEGPENVSARVHFVPGGDPLGLVNVAGAGVLAGSDAEPAARAAVEFLLSPQAQQYFADETAEYPVRDGVVSTVHDLPPLGDLQPPDLDLAELSSLAQTQALLQEAGLA